MDSLPNSSALIKPISVVFDTLEQSRGTDHFLKFQNLISCIQDFVNLIDNVYLLFVHVLLFCLVTNGRQNSLCLL